MTPEPSVYVNKHEMLIPFHVFKQLELSAVLNALLPKGKYRHASR